jgi:hypothetical protein
MKLEQKTANQEQADVPAPDLLFLIPAFYTYEGN